MSQYGYYTSTSSSGHQQQQQQKQQPAFTFGSSAEDDFEYDASVLNGGVKRSNTEPGGSYDRNKRARVETRSYYSSGDDSGHSNIGNQSNQNSYYSRREDGASSSYSETSSNGNNGYFSRRSDERGFSDNVNNSCNGNSYYSRRSLDENTSQQQCSNGNFSQHEFRNFSRNGNNSQQQCNNGNFSQHQFNSFSSNGISSQQQSSISSRSNGNFSQQQCNRFNSNGNYRTELTVNRNNFENNSLGGGESEFQNSKNSFLPPSRRNDNFSQPQQQSCNRNGHGSVSSSDGPQLMSVQTSPEPSELHSALTMPVYQTLDRADSWSRAMERQSARTQRQQPGPDTVTARSERGEQWAWGSGKQWTGPGDVWGDSSV